MKIRCKQCKTYVASGEITCPVCGLPVEKEEVTETGVMAIRQGRRGRQTMPVNHGQQEEKKTVRRRGDGGASRAYAGLSMDTTNVEGRIYGGTTDFEYGRYSARSESDADPEKRRKAHPKTYTVKKRMINWVAVRIVIMVFILGIVAGVFFYLRNTHSGQLIMARMGYDATTQAMWQVGEECLNSGNIDRAIELFEKAAEDVGEEGINVDGMLMLGEAYEAAGRVQDAEDLYTNLYTEVVPTRTEPYRNVIRLMLNQNRDAEAADLMQEAYDKTGINSFRNQRIELLPSAPTVDLVAAYYDEAKTLRLSSAEGYDIYYSFNNPGDLVEEGTLYTGPIWLDEGVYNLRAIAVNGDLRSDELKAKYQIIMPSPAKPGCNLAPETYKKRKTVSLRPGEANKNDKDITIYYTVDGSTPDADSPVWDGTPIQLPTGKQVWLKAIAVNGYGKASNMLQVQYYILVQPYPLAAMTYEDTVGKLSLGLTKRLDFENEFGTGTSVEAAVVPNCETAEKVTYPWGYAVFGRKKNGWALYELYFTNGQFKGPRNTGIGSTLDDIVGSFRDMGQVESPSGNRGLYADGNNTGRILMQEDGSRIIRYRCNSSDKHIWQLCYYINQSGNCYAIDWAWEN